MLDAILQMWILSVNQSHIDKYAVDLGIEIPNMNMSVIPPANVNYTQNIQNTQFEFTDDSQQTQETPKIENIKLDKKKYTKLTLDEEKHLIVLFIEQDYQHCSKKNQAVELIFELFKDRFPHSLMSCEKIKDRYYRKIRHIVSLG